MKEEELIKKLKSADLPAVEPQSHRRQLKMALLAAGCPQRRQGFDLSDLLKSIIKGGIDIIMKGLLSRQPVWKTASIGIVGLVLIAALSFTLPSFFTDSVYARAENIVKNNPTVQAALGDAEFDAVQMQVIGNNGGKVTVLLPGKNTITAEVDLDGEEVTKIFVIPNFIPDSITMPEVTEADKQEALRITEADPGVRELLDKGGTIDESSFGCCIKMATNPETNQVSSVIGKFGSVQIEMDGEVWVAEVNIDEGKVSNLWVSSNSEGELFPYHPTQTPPTAPDTQE